MNLADAVAARTASALAAGALQPIETDETALADGGVVFRIRRVASLAEKERLRRERAAAPRAAVDPFDPPDPALVVADVSPTHVAVLNKFPVIARHVLFVTRRFVDQETLLDAGDMQALALGLAALDGLAIYNGGAVAGASQPHRHLQLVPLPLATPGPPVPIEAAFEAEAGVGGPTTVARLGFAHALVRSAGAWDESGAALLDAYYAALAAAGLHVREGRPSSPYNLIATRRWLLLVPRAQERFGAISINAFGFAGSLFVRDDTELAALRAAGPMAALRAVAAERRP